MGASIKAPIKPDHDPLAWDPGTDDSLAEEDKLFGEPSLDAMSPPGSGPAPATTSGVGADWEALSVRVALHALGSLEPELEAALIRLVQRRGGRDAAAASALVAEARARASDLVISELELRVFGVWFGAETVAALEIPEIESHIAALAERAPIPDLVALLSLLFNALPGPPGREARVLEMAQRLGADPLLVSALRGDRAPWTLTLEGQTITVGRAETNDVVLPDARVAPLHAELIRSGGAWRVRSCSPRATVVGDAAVTSGPVPSGVPLRVGPYTLRLEQRTLTVEPGPAPFALHALGLSRRRGERQILKNVGLTVLSGEVIAVVGPSGAGKTTLIGALTGSSPPDEGEVRLDGKPLTQWLVGNPALLGEVPQDDLVFSELTVEENLRFAARLRLPDAASPAEREAEVARVLTELDLEAIRHQRVGDPDARGISGGQRKRVNVGQELVSRNLGLLFLDEPTSGLDPRSATEIARLARRLADPGRIVIIVTHDMSSTILNQVDHLLVMVPGGQVAWFGPPSDAHTWFGAESPAAIFERLSDHRPSTWANRFATSSVARRLVGLRGHAVEEGLPGDPPPAPAPRRWLPMFLMLLHRYALVKVRDSAGLFVLGLQPLLLAVVMQLVFRETTDTLVFMLTLASLWFGMSGAVRELIRDRSIWHRERRVGVPVSAWILSKMVVLSGLVTLQCAVLGAWVHLGVGLGEHGFVLPKLLGALVLTGMVGMATGLLVSALWRSSEAAVGTIVLLLVPQLAFSGIMMPISEMGGIAAALSWGVPVRYAFHLVLQTGETLAYLNTASVWQSRSISGELFLLGLRAPGAGSIGMPAGQLVLILGGLTAAQLAAAALGLRRERKR